MGRNENWFFMNFLRRAAFEHYGGSPRSPRTGPASRGRPRSPIPGGLDRPALAQFIRTGPWPSDVKARFEALAWAGPGGIDELYEAGELAQRIGLG